MISEQSKSLITESFQTIAMVPDQIATDFYGRLFELAPETQTLFRGDFSTHAGKLIKLLAMAVDSMDHMDTLAEPLARLGRYHAGMGVRPEYHVLAAVALVETLGARAGENWTHDHAAAWRELLATLSDAMLRQGAGSGEHEPGSVA